MIELSTRGDVAHQNIASAVVALLDNARLALGSNRADAESCIVRASAMVLAAADGRIVGDEAPVTAARGGLAPWQLRRVIGHIDACLAAPIRVRDFNQITGLSTSHFARAFKASVGASVHAYIIRRRIARARELMLASEDSLAQIALACGMSDQAHFSRLFRRIMGVSPLVWRRQWHRDGGGNRSRQPVPHFDPRQRRAMQDHLVSRSAVPQLMPQPMESAA